MYRRKSSLRFALAALVALGVVGAYAPAVSASAEQLVLNLTFDKSAVAPGVWRGSVAGDVSGHLETRLLSAHGDGPVLQVRFVWIILAGDMSFTAKAAGTLNTETGAVIMQGSVVKGFLKDACFLEQGQLVDPITSRFQGSIKLVHGGCD